MCPLHFKTWTDSTLSYMFWCDSYVLDLNSNSWAAKIFLSSWFSPLKFDCRAKANPHFRIIHISHKCILCCNNQHDFGCGVSIFGWNRYMPRSPASVIAMILRAKLNLAMPKNHDNSLEREIRSTCNTHVRLCIAPHDSWQCCAVCGPERRRGPS